MAKAKPSIQAMQRYRDRMRAQGLRPVQLWAPDTRSPTFLEEFKRQALAVARHERARSPERDAIDAFLGEQDDSGWTA
jgi:Protein  of unknown function (DUF3018)